MKTAELLPRMLAAVAEGEAITDVSALFSVASGFPVSKVRTTHYRGREQLDKHHGNSVLTAMEERALVPATQAFSYANSSLTRPQLTALVEDLWGKEVGQTRARD